MGRAHSLAYALAPIAAELGTTVVKDVLVDADADIAARKAAELGWRRSATDWREIIEDSTIDIVDICTPPQFHEEIAAATIRAGKHVFCEKPITNDAAEADRLWELASGAPVRAQVGFNYRHTPAVAFAKELLDSGRLGTPLQFRATYLQETGFNADPNRWRATKAAGGSGSVGDIGSHIIDMAEYLLGDISRVSARMRSKSPDTEGAWVDEQRRRNEDLVDDSGVWLAEFADGTIGSFAVNSFSSGAKNQIRFELDATKGAVTFDWNDREVCRVSYVDEDPQHRGFRSIHMDSNHPGGWWRIGGLGTGYVEVSALQIQSFIRSIVDEAPAEPGFDDAAHIQHVVDAIAEAANSTSWVDVTPITKEHN